MRRGYRERKVFVMLVFLLLARESTEEKGGIGKRGLICVAIEEGWEEGFAGLYILLSLPLVSWRELSVVMSLELERPVERGVPTLSCALE